MSGGFRARPARRLGVAAPAAAADGGDTVFSTAGIGIDETGYQDQVKRREAWEQAHRGQIYRDAVLHDWAAFLAGAVPFPFSEGTGPTFKDLKAALDSLDRAEAAGLCPVHRRPS